MILSCVVQTINRSNIGLNYNYNFSFIGLLNWLPLFWCFWGFQPYLFTKSQRERCIKFVLAGSIPLLISCLGQYYFNWYGPFEFLNGFVIWFQKPIANNSQGLTGFFNNQNYAGMWLSIIFYFGLAFTVVRPEEKTKKIIAFIVTFFIGLTTFLTYSRNSILSIFVWIQFFLKSKKISIFILFFALALFLVIFVNDLYVCTNFNRNNFLERENILMIIFQKLSVTVRELLPSGLYNKINKDIISEGIQSSPRFLIWSVAIKSILERKLFGWGAGSFPLVIDSKSIVNQSFQHTHNLPLEVAFNFGIPSALILTISLLLLTYKNFIIEFSLKNSLKFSKENIFDTAWKTSVGIFLFSHLFDITYFDSRISVLAWILLSGMRNILREYNTRRINPRDFCEDT
tara:strand:- start:852 stop:2051 length:1200 start_codon:yes stop_codon:yes gene_type:complete